MAEEYVWMTEWVLFYYNNFYVPCISKQTSSVFGWQYVDERATKGSGRFHSNQRDYDKDVYLIVGNIICHMTICTIEWSERQATR